MPSENLPLDIHPVKSNICISAEENNDCVDDPNLPCPRLTCDIRFIHKISFDNNTLIPTDELTIHTSHHVFHHNLYELLGHVYLAEGAVFRMLSSIDIPFSIDGKSKDDNMYFKMCDFPDDSSKILSPLHTYVEVVFLIAEAVLGVAETATKAGRKLAEMIITIDKHSIVLHEEFQRLVSTMSPDPNKNNNHLNNEDEDDYDDYDDKYWAIEKGLLDSLDRCSKRASHLPVGRKRQRVEEIATMIKEREGKL